MQVWIPYLATALLVADLIFMLVGSGWLGVARGDKRKKPYASNKLNRKKRVR
jgi:hypothetical protein